MSPTLTYFPLRGLGEVIRILLHDQKYEFVNEMIEFPNWEEVKEKGIQDGSLPFGQLPRWTLPDGKSLVQSAAIVRHLGRELHLYGKDNWESSLVDQCFDACADWRKEYGTLIGLADFSQEKVNEFVAKKRNLQFNEVLKKTGTGYLVGNSITIADYSLFDILSTVVSLAPQVLDNAPELKSFYEKIGSRPNLKAYIDSNPVQRQFRKNNAAFT